MKPMGAVFYDLSSLIQISENGNARSTCSDKYFEASGDVVLEGNNNGSINFGLRLRILQKETDQILRRKREGDIILVDSNFGLDAKELIILNENPTKGKSATVFDVGSIVGSKTGGTMRDFFKMTPIIKAEEDNVNGMLLR